MSIEEFKKALSDLSITIDDSQMNQLEEYLALLDKWNQVMDLTAIKEIDDMREKHLLDSLELVRVITFDNQSLLDVGSGAGLPGIVLKIVFPNLKVVLLEPTQKRVNFLNAVIEALKLKDIEVIADRAEDYIKNARESFDIVTARAVARLNILLELTLPYVKVNGTLVLLKGSKVNEEIKEATSAFKTLDSSLKEVLPYTLSDGIKRNILKIVKNNKTNNMYPRHYGAIKKKPL